MEKPNLLGVWRNNSANINGAARSLSFRTTYRHSRKILNITGRKSICKIESMLPRLTNEQVLPAVHDGLGCEVGPAARLAESGKKGVATCKISGDGTCEE